MQRGEHEVPPRRRELVGGRGNAARRIEAGVEARGQLFEIARQAVLGGATRGTLHLQPHGARAEQALHRPHGGRKGDALGLRESLEQRPCRLVGEPIQDRHFLLAGGRGRDDAHASVARGLARADQTLGLQASQQPAQVSGVEIQAGAQAPHLDAVGTNLAEHPRGPERAVPPEEPTLQGPDLMGHGSIEAPDLGDLVHYLTLVRYFPGSKRTASAGEQGAGRCGLRMGLTTPRSRPRPRSTRRS